MEPYIDFYVGDVPDFLRKSEFFETLNVEDEDKISLPAKVFKRDTTVNSVAEAAHLLSTLQFWGSDVIPIDLLKLVCIETQSAIAQMLDRYDEAFSIVRLLRGVIKGDDAQRVNFILTKGNLDMVKILVERSPEWDRESACKHAAISGNLDCLQYMHNLGGVLNSSVCAVACRGGFIDCARYILENGVERNSFFTYCAVEHGHVDMLKFLHSVSCPWDSFTARCAAENDHIGCVKYLFDNNCPFDSDVATGAAASGRLAVLKYLFQVGCPWDMNTTQNAAYHGQIECLRFLHEKGCPWNRSAPAYAALRGNFECLIFLHENNCPWDALTTAMTAEKNNLEMMKYAHERGCPISPTAYRWAARYGNVEMMRFARDHFVDWEHVRGDTVIEATKSGSLECLVFAHENGCTMSAEHAYYAAAGGHLSCLKYLLAHVDVHAGEVRNDNVGSTCAAAAEHGHLDCLVCLHANKCGWDKGTSKGAASKGHLECLKYAVENGCRLDKEACYVAAVRGKHTNCAEYLVSLGEEKVVPRASFCCRLS